MEIDYSIIKKSLSSQTCESCLHSLATDVKRKNNWMLSREGISISINLLEILSFNYFFCILSEGIYFFRKFLLICSVKETTISKYLSSSTRWHHNLNFSKKWTSLPPASIKSVVGWMQFTLRWYFKVSLELKSQTRNLLLAYST